MAVMNFDRAATLSPSVVNKIGGAGGLMQFTVPAEQQLGVTKEPLATMSAVEQRDQVEKHFQPYAGNPQTVGNTPDGGAVPAAGGGDDEDVLLDRDDRNPRRCLSYTPNAALDVNDDGKLTKEEARTPEQKRLAAGRLPKNLGEPSPHRGMRCVAEMFRV